jgi:hypothetical protein
MSATTHRKARKDGKARKFYTNEADYRGESTATFSKYADPSDDRLWTLPVAVLELSPSADAARIEAGRRAILAIYGEHNYSPSLAAMASKYAEACLTAIGALSTPGKGRKGEG